MRVFDVNSSYGRGARPPHRYAATPSELIEQMDFCGIDAALVFHTNQRFASPVTWNPVVIEETRSLPRLHPTWAILPESCGELPAPEVFLEFMQAHGIRALWAFPQEHRYRLDGHACPELFRLMARHRIPLLAKENLFQMKELLTDCPDLIVIAMNQGPHNLERHLRPLMDRFPNLHVDTSYFITDGLIEGLCERYGAERLIFGSAYPDNCAGGSLLRLAHAEIGEESRAKIAAGNLERLLAWDQTPRQQDRSDMVPRSATESPIVAEYMVKGQSDDCPIIDMHGHWGVLGSVYLPRATEEPMIASLRRAGVQKVVCSGHDALFADPERGNRTLQEAILRHPDVLRGYWAVNPNYPALAARAGDDFERSQGFVGMKCLPDYHVYPLTGPNYRPALEYANDKSLLVLVHTWGHSAHNSPQMLGEIAARYPRAMFLMGHSGFGDWPGAVQVTRERPNVYLELAAVCMAHDFAMQPSGSGTPAALISCVHVNGILEHFVDQVGSQKVVFGTDIPWYNPHYAAGTVLLARIDDAARRDILYRNAERLLRLTQVSGTWSAEGTMR